MEHVSSVRPTGKFPEKVENLKRWSRFPGWNFRTESRVPFTFLVVCTSSRFTVGHRDVPGFTNQMEQLFTNRKFHFCYHWNFRVFFLNGKRPSLTTVNSAKDFLLSIFLFVLSTHYSRVNSSIANWIALYYWAPTEFFERKPNVLSAFINRNENCVLQTQLSLTR